MATAAPPAVWLLTAPFGLTQDPYIVLTADAFVDRLGADPLPEIGIATSLLFILATLTITVGASLARTRMEARRSLWTVGVRRAGDSSAALRPPRRRTRR
ncbi:MAG: tellurium resistance protein TerC [Blastococcus sp.]|nr:tellurium resistance protein TerC [Blastococcus sp.]